MLVKLAVLFSGNGSNLENILNKLHKKAINNNSFEIVLCLCNKKDAFGIQRAKKFGLETIIIENKNFQNRQDFDKVLVDEIKKSGAHLTILAGFMRILSPVFTQNIKAINLHPSLLPLFKGANAIKESFESDMKVAGVSVHFVNEELDSGKIIAQKAFEKGNLNFKDFEKKIHELEYELLPQAIISLFE
ncbi:MULTISPECIES: phosphoribosylglycinamide formyltransferase [unclassified Campylobacter]|uniref:phosphoribosylglycinamide formyltransferase n=1 Tax=unclassified Campylobacter TaxID=2593542 RepID=UPI00123806E5|nr:MULTISPECIES: phosphoribosylglycinamide formyltransferase [unclassified Campylobacter]KAA6225131.1 phosphoribosylglycinamide formyltransferase [Campylobacter sp. LR196d]KAA6226145.1 phosphoribosylglycinamide formyltransferase [Campylobacter sp. LR185c]KAA6228093.1 phosphoribosylglycinamide formyltransferase [Campylobacter sp. LR286c]KAA6231345.1 phosphoribosylglycinamide formyltransferase [Campylobacter sp. LR264d]KAA6231557.1 phosphoribosylglycinamide formyltransferase [Campylobacter sp. L